jgi:TRAP transporter 4TM/12TM fusion protein
MTEPKPQTQTFLSSEPEEATEGLPPGWGEGFAGRIAFWIAVAFSAFQLYTAAYGTLPSQVVRAMHVGFLLLLGFVLIGNLTARSTIGKAWFWLLGGLGMLTGIYHWVEYVPLIQRSGFLTNMDLAVGVVLIVLVFEGARRLMGLPLAIIAGIFLAYCFFGHYLPAPFIHRGYDFAQIIENFAFGTEGIYGTPIYVSAAYIFIFVVFAAFLERAGMIALFNDVALGLVGSWRGGPAQVCVLSSALMGTISGSGVANVVASGQFTIPLMKRFGFRSAFAGGVEATSSMGGQIMPPVMGAVAFIMAETIGVPYVEICKAAVIPAVLYFLTAFMMVHPEAGRAHLLGLAKEDCPNPWRAVRERWHLLLPLGILIWLLFAGYTPLFAGTIGLALTVVLIFGAAITRAIGPMGMRVLVWIAIGLACSAFAKFGVTAVIVVAVALGFVVLAVKGGRETVRLAINALAEGARHALPVGIACALVGVIIGVLALTGAATTLAGYIIGLGKDSLFLSLLLTMFVCLVLGMGIPTIPNYIITSSIAAPALLELGVPLIVSHMFVFYFGILADLTPPVALAAFAAAPIARASGLKIGLQAMRIAVAGFVVPYIAVYDPMLMLQGAWTVPGVAYVVFKTVVAIALWGGVAIGYWLRPLSWIERALAFVAAALLIAAVPLTDQLGFGLAALLFAWHALRTRRQAAPA